MIRVKILFNGSLRAFNFMVVFPYCIANILEWVYCVAINNTYSTLIVVDLTFIAGTFSQEVLRGLDRTTKKLFRLAVYRNRGHPISVSYHTWKLLRLKAKKTSAETFLIHSLRRNFNSLRKRTIYFQASFLLFLTRSQCIVITSREEKENVLN